MTVTPNLNPVVQSGYVNYTITVTGSFGTPTGQVQLMADGTNFNVARTLAGGSAVVQDHLTTIGSHTIVATYTGDATYASGASGGFLEWVAPPTTITTDETARTIVYGQQITYTATVTGAGSPITDGSVRFSYVPNSTGHAIVFATVPVDSNGQASFTFDGATLPLGSGYVNEDYLGTAHYLPKSPPTPALTITPAATTTNLVVSPNPSLLGQNVTLTATVAPLSPGAGVPTGTVTFTYSSAFGTGTLGTVTLTNGTAAFVSTPQFGGDTFVSASYNGDSNFTTSSGFGDQFVDTSSHVAVTGSPNPSVTGQDAHYTATVTDPAGNPVETGSVTLSVDGTQIPGSFELNNFNHGVVSTDGPLAAGQHTIEFDYGGAANHDPASGTFTETVLPAETTTAVVGPGSSTVGAQATFTATVLVNAPGSGTDTPPTGSVEFRDGSTTLGSVVLAGNTATFTTSALAVGGHTITAVYNGDANFSASTGTTSHTVNAIATTAHLSALPSPTSSTYGQLVSFTVTVDPVAPATGTVTGTVEFKDNGVVIPGSSTSLSFGGADLYTTLLAVGTHTISVDFTGDSYAPSSDSMTFVVLKGSTTVDVTLRPNPSTPSQDVMAGALVSPVYPGQPNYASDIGAVQFAVDGVDVGTPQPVDNNLIATISLGALAGGNHTVTATVADTEAFNGSTGSSTQSVAFPSTTTVTSSANPSLYTQPVTFTATVQYGSAQPAPGGTVTFREGSTTLQGATAVNAQGRVTFTTSSLPAGPHTITALYSGTSTVLPSSGSVSQSVDKEPTAATVSASPASSVSGQSVAFTATVTPVAPATGAVTGGVRFQDNGVDLPGGSVGLSGGTATINTNALTVGSHTISIVFGGGSSFEASSDSMTFVVAKGDSTVTVTTAPNPSSPTRAVTATAVVHFVRPASPFSDSELGPIQFAVDGTNVGSPQTLVGAAYNDYEASLSLGNLGVGTHTVTAIVADTPTFNGSSDSTAQVVVKDDSTTSLASSAASSTFGQDVTFTATVKNGSARVTLGSVIFKEGTNVLAGPLTLDASGQASFDSSTLPAGAHTISAEYSGNDDVNPSSGAVAQSVGKATPAFADLNSPSIEAGTASATLSGQLTAGALVPPGSVHVTLDGVTHDAPIAVDGSWSATFDTSSQLTAHVLDWTAVFDEAYDFDAATATSTLTIVDTTPPSLTVPADIHVNAAPGAATAAVTFSTDASDNSGVVTTVCAPPSGSDFPLGDTTVTCTATDPSGNSTSHSFHVFVNGPPSATVSLSPAAPKTGETITATVGSSDPDGDPVTTSIRWYVNGTLQPGLTGTSFTAPHRGDVVRVEVTPNDSKVDGPVASDHVTVANTPPTIVLTSSSVTVQYSDGVSDAVTVFDADGDPLTVTSSGLPAGVSASASAVSGAVTAAPGTYGATITVSDGTDSASKPLAITVLKEDATAAYTGPALFTTTTATLTAKLTQANDGSPGDIQKGSVDFLLTQGATTQTIANVPVDALGGATTTVTLAAGDWQLAVRPSLANAYYSGPASTTTFSIGATDDNRRAHGTGDLSKDVHFEFEALTEKDGTLDKKLHFEWKDAVGKKHTFDAKDPSSLVFLGASLNRAVVTYSGKLDGANGYSATIDVTDNGNPGKGNDTFSIRITAPNGALTYALGATPLTGGNIDISGKK